MILPNKITPLKDSIVFKMFAILELEFVFIDIGELYSFVEEKFHIIDEFIYALDVLFILGKIDINEKGQIVKC